MLGLGVSASVPWEERKNPMKSIRDCITDPERSETGLYQSSLSRVTQLIG